ncbi:hypothetical protein ABZ471_09635 [Streptomyces sp. NPDC005728]
MRILTISRTYDGVVIDRLKALFRVYADGITERRGCADVKFPADKDFDRR